MVRIGSIFKSLRRAMDLETFWYEALPYLYAIGGGIAILHGGPALLKVSGVLLVVASLTILRLRRVHRRQSIARLPTAHDIAALPVHDD